MTHATSNRLRLRRPEHRRRRPARDRPVREARRRHRRLLGPRAGDDACAGRGGRPRRRPRPAAGGRAGGGRAASTASRSTTLDLADLDSVRGFAERFLASGRGIDIVINNAGRHGLPRDAGRPGLGGAVRDQPPRPLRARQPALAGDRTRRRARRLRLLGRPPRSSGIRWDDVQFEHGYDKWQAYGQAKTANVLFAVQLDALGRDAGRTGVLAAPRRHPHPAAAPPAQGGDGRRGLDRRGRQPGRTRLQDARAGRGDPGVGGDVTAAGGHGRRLLRGLRHRRAAPGDRLRRRRCTRLRDRPRARPRACGHCPPSSPASTPSRPRTEANDLRKMACAEQKVPPPSVIGIWRFGRAPTVRACA